MVTMGSVLVKVLTERRQVKNVVNKKQIRCMVLAMLGVLMSGVGIRALDPSLPIKSFLRTHFTTDDGLPGGVVDEIGQTPDGFLWLITNANNLVRFDGKRFYYFDKPRPRTLAVAPDGDLWVGTNEELIRIPSSNFKQSVITELIPFHPGPGKASQINCLRFSRSGVLWVGTGDGLYRYDGDQFLAVGPRSPTRQIQEAPDGHILVSTEEGFVQLDGSEIVPNAGIAGRLGVKENEIFDALRDTHGNTWYCTPLGVARQTGGRIEKLGTYASNGHGAFRVFEDAQATIWIGKDEGLFRATSSGVELVAAGMKVRSLNSDRDGNLWVGTNGDGLHRFKERPVRMFTTEDGLPNNLTMTVLATRDGAVWTGANCGGIARFDGTRFQSLNEKDGLLNSCVFALAEDSNRDLWVGTWGGGAFRYHDGKFTQYSKPQGLLDDRVTSIVPARDGSIWLGTRGGLARLRDGQVRNYTTADGLSGNSIFRVYEDRAGVIWAANRQGLDRLQEDRFENFGAVPRSLVIPLGEDRDGGFFVNINHESAIRLDEERRDALRELSEPTDMLETGRGELWFGGNVISKVPPGSFIRSRPHDEPLDYEAFSMADGLTTAQATGGAQHNLALTADDKLWAATPKGVAMFDLRRLPSANVNPLIYLRDVTIGRKRDHAGPEVVLPPGTNHFEIEFAAVDISSPEKLRLQYRLDDVDSEWLDAPSDPRAIYSSIPVGTHLLHIRASNARGIWERQGVVFNVTQQPYFYQTRGFAAAMLALGLVLLGLIYRLRVAQISRRLGDRFDERLAERTRVAREIHDTFLQTVQGSKMVADHALRDPADHERMVRAMEKLSTWLEQATEEGRAALNSLRASTTERNDLAEAFRRAAENCAVDGSSTPTFSVVGESRDIHPIVRDEIYRIGYEAIRNACVHSGASVIEVELRYETDLIVRVKDNGKGIEPLIASEGKEGHFGLTGMRERAERVGATIILDTSTGSGTEITLIVPGNIAFRTSMPPE